MNDLTSDRRDREGKGEEMEGGGEGRGKGRIRKRRKVRRKEMGERMEDKDWRKRHGKKDGE